jgi:1,4-dihydroxy-2-naphthoyl-CoA synthase
VGHVAAKKIFMLSKTMDANEMLRVGFLTELVSHDDLDKTVEDYQKSILECDSSVSVSMKKNINVFASGDLSPKIWIQKYREALGSEEMARRLGKDQ